MKTKINEVKNVSLIGTKNFYFLDVDSAEGGRVEIILNREQVKYLAKAIEEQEEIQKILDGVSKK
jgi:hypothetical protein